MKFAALIVLSLSALALAGPAYNKQQQQDYDRQSTGIKSTGNTEAILKKWCSSSDMSQEQLTGSFKELVQAIKSQPEDQSVEQLVMNERICQGIMESSNKVSDTKVHDYIKDVYMDALIACDSHQCMKQLNKIISSHEVDSVRASYYMTRLAVSDKDSIKDEQQVIAQAESFVQSPKKTSPSVERQQMFAATSLIGKYLKDAKQHKQASQEIKNIAKQVATTIVSRYIKPVSQQEVKQYQEQSSTNSQMAMKIAKRNAALKALANLPGWLIAEIQEVQKVCLEIAQNKDEMLTARQSAIECLEHSATCQQQLKQLTFDQEEPTEVRVAAYRALMTTFGQEQQQQQAEQIVKQIVDHCEQQQNQQEDEQFVLYVISHLENLSTSQQPEHEQLKECIKANKQMNMKIQLLNKKFKRALSDIRKSSRNYKLEQEFSPIESGLIIEGDLIYESKHWAQKQQQPISAQILPKLVRVNMSMPVMGETVNVIEVTVRQNKMDEHFLSALKLAQSSKFTGESVGRLVDSFKSSVNKQQQQQQQQEPQSAEADISIKVDGCTVVYVCVDDFKTNEFSTGHQRYTRSTYSIVDEIIEHLKRNPIAFNRGFNFNVNERFAKLLDVDASLIAGLRFESRATGQSSEDFEIVTKAEPRFALEAVVGPAKLNKKLLQRLSTKTAVGMRLRFKRDQLVDVQLDLPYNTMELFTVETKIVEQTPSGSYVELKNQQLLPTLLSKKSSNSVFTNWMSSGKRGSSWMPTVGPIEHTWQMSEKSARAIGLRGQLRLVAKNTGLMVQAVCQKYEPNMQGYRVQVKRVASSGAANQEQYLWILTTPGSQIDRTMQVRITKQEQPGRLFVKTEMKSPKQSIVAVWELIRDGRQYGVKAELASVRPNNQWRHSFSAGLQSTNSARFGTFKPFVSIKSTELKRPIEMQGTITVQEEPKFVITYNMRCPTNENFVQGKLVIEQRSSSAASAAYRRRSMRSPVELVLQRDLTLTKEIVAQLGQRFALKAHSMLDWDATKSAVQCETSMTTKNLAKSKESQYQVQLKLDSEQQKINVERKCLDNPRKDHRFTLQAGFNSPKSHQIQLEAQYHGKRQPQAVVVFKHIVDFNQLSGNKLDLSAQVELISSEHNINEKFTGRTQITNERRLKQIHTELQGRNKQCKLNVDFVSLAEHQIELVFKGQQWQHQTAVRADRRQFDLQSRTHRFGKKQGEVQVTYQKDSNECQIVYDCAISQVRFVADLKPVSGKQSSVAIQTPTLQSKAEFYFESMPVKSSLLAGKRFWTGLKPQLNQLRFKTDLKDLINQEAYWMDSHYTNQPSGKSFIRMDSPIYRTDIEYDPSVEETKFGLFARSKRSTDSYNQLYSTSGQDYFQDSFDVANWSQKLGPNKMWMLRSLISSPRSMEQLKQKARRALFEYADKRQSQKHQFQYEPLKGINFDMERKPFGSIEQSMRLKGDLNLFNMNQQDMRPSTFSMDSDIFEMDFESKPFDQEESYAKLNAVSRFPRSTFKHNSEYRFQKNKGYKAQMKHEDQEGKRHQWQLEADEEPQRFGKMSYESEKHGKVDAEYNWRKHLTKRSHDNEDIYANRVAFKAQTPRQGKQYVHESSLNWEEPRKMIEGRYRRDIFSGRDMQQQRRYNVVDYLKHIDARLQSRTEKNQNELYNVDFDYKPESHARLSVQMPEDMLHQSSFEYQPTERLYKLQSKLYNRRTQQPSYEISANTKPVLGLATSEQEPVFVDYEHSILERPIQGRFSSLFKQPMRLDYTDKFGRVANLDYDFAPLTSGEQKELYSGLRQKRAAVYYKDQDFEHSSNYDFYPETVFGQIKPSKRVPGDVVMKAQTKYGPIVLHADSSGQEVELKVETPVISGEITCEAKRQGKLFKINLDNKQQNVKLSKIVRQVPILEDIELVKDLAKKIDESRFEHESELLVSFVSAILKLKSETKMNQRPVMVIDAELNKQLEKAYVKINGERITGQAVVDLANMTADLVLDVDDKRTLLHRTRLVRIDQDFYGMESMTSYKSKPIIKLNAKICAKIFDASHSFSSRRHSGIMSAEHISTFDAVIYTTKSEPKQITGQYDCVAKEARVIYKDLTGRSVSDVRIKYDDQAEDLYVAVRATGQNGTTKQFQKTINVSPLVEAY